MLLKKKVISSSKNQYVSYPEIGDANFKCALWNFKQ